MAVGRLLSREVSDLCIGRPALRPLPPSATVYDALSAIRTCGEAFLSVPSPDKKPSAVAGRVCMVDVLCFLCSDDNIKDPVNALRSPVAALLRYKEAGLVHRVEPNSSVLHALDLILEGWAQNLVVPIRSGAGRKKLGAAEFCWLTQEDFVRFFFNSIAIFSPAPSQSVTALGLVRSDVLAVRHHEPALAALPLIRRALAAQTSVAVVTDDGKLIGEISPSTLAGCDETVAAAMAALSAGDLMAYIDCCGAPPEAAVQAIKGRLKDSGLEGMMGLMEDEKLSTNSALMFPGSSSSDEDSSGGKRRDMKLRKHRSGSYTARMGRKSEEAIVCHPESSLVAVMVQALAHRVSYAWVVDEEDYNLVGIVALRDVLKIFRGQL